MRPLLSVLAFLLRAGCGSETPKTAAPATAEKPAPPPKPSDESARFPKAGLLRTEVVDDHVLGKSFMPGGTVAHYRRGKSEYDMFVAKLATPTDAAILLLDWKKALADAVLIASFGGYSGSDSGRPVFVFTKGSWLAGIAGLPQKQADLQGRLLAARLD
jgi:hypothetical protein